MADLPFPLRLSWLRMWCTVFSSKQVIRCVTVLFQSANCWVCVNCHRPEEFQFWLRVNTRQAPDKRWVTDSTAGCVSGTPQGSVQWQKGEVRSKWIWRVSTRRGKSFVRSQVGFGLVSAKCRGFIYSLGERRVLHLWRYDSGQHFWGVLSSIQMEWVSDRNSPSSISSLLVT